MGGVLVPSDDGGSSAKEVSADARFIVGGPAYLADMLAAEGAELHWNPEAVERVRYDAETGWLHMAVSGDSFYVGLQISEGLRFEFPWHDFDQPEDVNSRDGVTELDALLTINFLNRQDTPTSEPLLNDLRSSAARPP